MHSNIRFSRDDYACLRQLARGEHLRCRLNADQSHVLDALLSAAATGGEPGVLAHHVGLHDTVALVSETDPQDTFVLRVVMPSDEDIDADRIGVGKPVALAVLGRRVNEHVSWAGPRCIRTMVIADIRKAEAPVTAP